MRRQGLEPRTDALREPDGRSLDLLGSVDTCPDLGIGYRCCPLMTPGCRSFAAPPRPTVGHAEGMAGENQPCSGGAATVTSSGDG